MYSKIEIVNINNSLNDICVCFALMPRYGSIFTEVVQRDSGLCNLSLSVKLDPLLYVTSTYSYSLNELSKLHSRMNRKIAKNKNKTISLLYS